MRVQATNRWTLTDDRGRFVFKEVGVRPVRLTAHAVGYYIAGPVLAHPGAADIRVTLRPHPEADNSDYQWLSAFSSSGEAESCQNCHSEPGVAKSKLPFDEWVADAHGRSGRNRRFLSVYNGTDLSGRNQSPRTRFALDKDYGRVPLPPDPGRPYFGPGFKLDFPDSAGNCAACHLPNAAVRAPYGTDPNSLRDGAASEGVGCDLCHKIWSVRLNPATGWPYPNTPGVLSMEFLRPSHPNQLFLGPFDDVGGREDIYSPLYRQSAFCAPCHFGVFWGVEIYNSFGEWLSSPYSDRRDGKTCQDCHMPRRGATHFARLDRGGLHRDPNEIGSHRMPGASDVRFLREAVQLRLVVGRTGGVLRVTATVSNVGAGHHIPTDHPARNMLLVISATDSFGNSLPLLSGSVIPEWGGRGSEPEDYAGLPGKAFAKILEEAWTGIIPTVAYWNPTVLREDTRIAALARDSSTYDFEAPPRGGPVQVTGKLVFRRAFRDVIRRKAWDVPDMVLWQTTVDDPFTVN